VYKALSSNQVDHLGAGLKKLVCCKFILLHKEIARAKATDSAMNMELESCIYAFIERKKGG
jgi:hypothetical protein